jgi:hypothetical protein
LDWVQESQDTEGSGEFCSYDNETSCSTKYAELLEKLSDYQLVQDSTPIYITMLLLLLLLPRVLISMHKLVFGCGIDSFLIML